MATVTKNTFGDNAYYLEKHEIEIDTDEEYDFQEIVLDDHDGEAGFPDGDEDFDTVVRVIKEHNLDDKLIKDAQNQIRPKGNKVNEQVDDFVRNFLMKMGMHRTLDAFQNEWYEKQEKGELNQADCGLVPDIYSQNQRLRTEMYRFQADAKNYQRAAANAREMCIKMKKERDFHKLEHRRLTNEKSKLVKDIRRLKEHYAEYEPALKDLQQKYELAMRQKMLTKIDRDRALGQISGLQDTVKQLESKTSLDYGQSGGGGVGVTTSAAASLKQQSNFSQNAGGTRDEIENERDGTFATSVSHFQEPTKQSVTRVRGKASMGDAKAQAIAAGDHTSASHPNDSQFPPDKGINPQLQQLKSMQINLRATGMRLANSLELHNGNPVSEVTLHPTKPVAVSASDDKLWKLWTVPSGELLMTGKGHEDWISSVKFHPNGSHLVTTSGDHSARLWDFAESKCVAVFEEHKAAVWDVDWHWTGDFFATGSADNSLKVWDINSQRCRTTLRGHSASVAGVHFLPYSNTLVSCSSDKSVSLWQANSPVCQHTFFGHLHPVLGVCFNPQGTLIASCDSFGNVRLWDVRAQRMLKNYQTVPHAANKVRFDPTGQLLAAASNDGSVKLIEVQTNKMGSLTGHKDAVQSVAFDPSAQFIVSCSSDGLVNFWN